MYISTKTLSWNLAEWRPETYGPDGVFFYEGYYLLKKLPKSDYSHCICILYSSDLIHDTIIPPAASYIIINNSPNWSPSPDARSVPIVVLNTPDAQQDIILQTLMKHYYQTSDTFHKLKQKLLHQISHGSSLQSILKAASRELENPFVVYDNNYSLVAHSIPPTLQIPAAQNVVKNGYANVEIISQMEKNGSLDYAFANQDSPVLVKIINGFEKLAVSIYNRGVYSGLLCYFNYVRPIFEEDYEIVQFVGELTRIYFQNQFTQNDYWTPWNYLFSTALNHRRELTSDMIDKLDVELPKEMKLMVIGTAGFFRTIHGNQLKYLQTRLFNQLPGSHQYFFDGYLICVDRSASLDIQSNLERWKNFQQELSKLNFVCGISNTFTSITTLFNAFQQACAAFDLGQKIQSKTTIHEYKDYIVPHIASLLEKNYAIEEFYHPALQSLIQYDAQYSTNYVEFLLVYFECNRNNHLCAECFNIHYNSVKYRLNVIQDIGKINLKDLNNLVSLHLSCQMYSMKHPEVLQKYTDFLNREPSNPQ